MQKKLQVEGSDGYYSSFLSEFRSKKQLSLPHDSALARILELRVLKSLVFKITSANREFMISNWTTFAVAK